MKECRVLPYAFRKCSLMSSMSISARATIILIRTLSVVPSPWGDSQTVWPRVKCTSISSVTRHEIFTFIDLYSRSAKKAGLLFTHFTEKNGKACLFSVTRTETEHSLVQGVLDEDASPQNLFQKIDWLITDWVFLFMEASFTPGSQCKTCVLNLSSASFFFHF